MNTLEILGCITLLVVVALAVGHYFGKVKFTFEILPPGSKD